MKRFTNTTAHWIGRHPKTRQWLWFWGLWLGGLGTATALAYPIKWLIRSLG